MIIRECETCGLIIHPKRVELFPDIKTCSTCSQVEPVGCIDIVNHKTGNTIQVLPKEQANKINKASRRSGFGTMYSMKKSSGSDKNPILKKVPLLKKFNKDEFEAIGKGLMDLIDQKDRTAALNYIEEIKRDRILTGERLRALREVLDIHLPEIKKEEKEIQIKIDPDIQHAFTNWKNEKTRR